MTDTIKKPRTPKTAEQKAAHVESQRRYREKKKAVAAEPISATIEEVSVAAEPILAVIEVAVDEAIEVAAQEDEALLKIQDQASEDEVLSKISDQEEGIRLSVGEHRGDNLPVQHTAASFEDMRETLLSVVSPRKHMAFFCAPFAVGFHDDQDKYPGEQAWRLGRLVLPRPWISFDCDGFGYPDAEEDAEMDPPAKCYEMLLARASSLKGFAHTTSSHTDELPRLRLTLALSRPVTRAEGIALGKALESDLAPNGGVLFDPVVYRGEQPCYLPVQIEGQPPFKSWCFDGAEVNPDDYLAGFVEPEVGTEREVEEWAPDEISRAESALMAIPNDLGRADWFKLLSAAKEAGVSKECAEAWSSQFDYKDTRKQCKADREFPYQWSTIKIGKAGGVSADFLFKEAAKAGWDDPAIGELFGDVKPDVLPRAEILDGVKELANYDELSYQQYRKASAKHFKISVAVLDQMVTAKKIEMAAAAAVAAGAASGTLNPTEGWFAPELTFTPLAAPEDGAALFADLVKTIKRFVFCSDHVAAAEAGWSMLTWMQDDLDLFPRLGGMAPSKACGKSRNLEVIELVVHNPLYVANCSPAVLFRVVQDRKPTLLLDEVDTWLTSRNASDELRGVINHGYKRPGNVPRVNPDTLEVELHSSFAPAALAGIGLLPETIASRSIPVRLTRKLVGEQADKLKRGEKKSFTPLRARIHRWITDNRKAVADLVQSGKCAIDLGNDRAEDNWEPLLALADKVGGEWPNMMRDAAKTLEANTGDDGNDRLLQDIREIMASNPMPTVPYGADAFHGTGHVVQEGGVIVKTLAAALHTHGWEKLTPRALGNMLVGYEIRSEPKWIAGKTVPCYSEIKLNVVFDRYLKAEDLPGEDKPGT